MALKSSSVSVANAYAFLNDDEEEEAQTSASKTKQSRKTSKPKARASSAQPSTSPSPPSATGQAITSETAAEGEAKKKAKKKRKKKKKATGEQEEGEGEEEVIAEGGPERVETSPIAEVISHCIGLGFSKAEVEACIDRMWAQGSDSYEDKQAVAEELLKQLPGHGESEDLLSPVPEVPEVEREEKQTRTQGAGEEPEENGRGSEEAPHEEDEEEAPPAKLTMAQKLEIAASHSEIDAAIIGLVAWAERYSTNPEMEDLFSSRALDLLFENLLISLHSVTATIEVQLLKFFSLCLASGKDTEETTSSGHHPMAVEVVKSVKTAVDALRVLRAKDTEMSVTPISQGLAEIVKAYHSRTSGRPGSLTAQFSTVNLKIQHSMNQLAALAGRDSLKDMFQRRDLQFEVSQLLYKKAQAVASVSKQHGFESFSAPGDESAGSIVSEAELTASLTPKEEAQKSSASARKLMQEVQRQLHKLKEERNTKLEPLKRDQAQLVEELSDLQNEKRDLLARLEAVESKMAQVTEMQKNVEVDMEIVERSYEIETAKYDAQHQGVMSLLQQAESREQVVKAVKALEEETTGYAKALNSSLESELQVALPSSCGEFFDSVLAYVSSEVDCVTYIKKRARDTATKLANLDREVEEYKSLGIHKIAAELSASADKCRELVHEDENAISALTGAAKGTLSNLRLVVKSLGSQVDTYLPILHAIKAKFAQLNIGSDWNLPPLGKSTSFDTQKAAYLGLHALLPQGARAQPETAGNGMEESDSVSVHSMSSIDNASITATAGSEVGSVHSARPATQPARPPPKMSWAAATSSQGSTGRSIYDIQKEELEGRLTRENLLRLEKGQRPTRSPLLDKIRTLQDEKGQAGASDPGLKEQE